MVAVVVGVVVVVVLRSQSRRYTAVCAWNLVWFFFLLFTVRQATTRRVLSITTSPSRCLSIASTPRQWACVPVYHCAPLAQRMASVPTAMASVVSIMGDDSDAHCTAVCEYIMRPT